MNNLPVSKIKRCCKNCSYFKKDEQYFRKLKSRTIIQQIPCKKDDLGAVKNRDGFCKFFPDNKQKLNDDWCGQYKEN